MAIISVLNKCEHPGTVLCSKICLGETHVATGCMDGITRLYKVKEGELIKTFVDDDIHTKPASVTGVSAVSQDEVRTIITSYSEGYMKFWSLHSGDCVRTIVEERQILGLVQNPHDTKFLSLGSDGIIYYYDNETGQKIRSFMSSQTHKTEGHTSRIFAAVFHPKQMNEFVSGGWDNTILYWDMRRPAAYRAILGPHICGEGLDINPTGHLILSCSYTVNNPFQLYEYSTGKAYISLEYNQNKLYCGKWIAPMYLATGSSDPTVLNIMDMYSINVISHYRSTDTGVYSMDCINLNSKRRNKRDEELYAIVVFASGNNLITIKVEFTHK